MRKAIIAVDIGGSGTKTVAFDLQGRVIGVAFEESEMFHPEPGVTYQDPQRMYDSVITGVRSVLARASEVRVEAIILDGQQAGLLWIDSTYHHVSPYDSWLDVRYLPFLQEMNRRVGDRAFALTGTDAYMHGPKVMWWNRNAPEVVERAAKWVVPASFVAGRLAGLAAEDAFVPDTDIAYSGLCDLRSATWDVELCEAAEMPFHRLPRILSPTTVIGRLAAEGAAAMGLTTGIPVFAGSGDFPAAGLGAGIVKRGQAGDIAGTASLFFSGLDTFAPDPQRVLRLSRGAIPGLWYLFAYLTGGAAVRWFRDTLAGEERAQAARERRSAYAVLDEMAARIPPGSDGLLFSPHLGGRVFPNQPEVCGGWLGASWNHTKAHFYRAILESVPYEYSIYMSRAEAISGVRPSELRMFGGGSGSPLWAQIKADILRLPVTVPEIQECSSLGLFILASTALGAYTSFQEACDQVVRTARRYEPEEASAEAYGAYIGRYRDWIPRARTA